MDELNEYIKTSFAFLCALLVDMDTTSGGSVWELDVKPGVERLPF